MHLAFDQALFSWRKFSLYTQNCKDTRITKGHPLSTDKLPRKINSTSIQQKSFLLKL